MKHVFIILPKRKLIIESIATEMGLDDYIVFKREQLAHPDFNPSYDVLTDLRWVKRGFSTDEVRGLVSFFKEQMPIHVSRKGCMITLKPLQTAYSMVFKKQTTGSAIRWTVCTTPREAMQWLNYPMEVDELEVTLANLKAVRETGI